MTAPYPPFIIAITFTTAKEKPLAPFTDEAAGSHGTGLSTSSATARVQRAPVLEGESMSRARTLTAAAAAAVIAVSVAASPASAWPAGDFTATLEQNLSFTLSTLGAPSVSTCTSSALEGDITSGGAITIDTAGFGGCTGAISSITALPTPSPSAKTALSLSWRWNLTPASGQPHDGIVSVTDFRLTVWLNTPGISCTYTGPFDGRYYHGTNPYRPKPSWPYLQFRFSSAPVHKSPSGSNFLCPNSGMITGVFLIDGIV